MKSDIVRAGTAWRKAVGGSRGHNRVISRVLGCMCDGIKQRKIDKQF